MTTYRLPAALGGGECTVAEPFRLGPYARATIGDGEDSFTIDLDRSLLVEVKPPLPEEPPVGAYRVGGVLCMRVSSEPAKCWVYQTKDEMFDEKTFADLCSDFGTDVIHLVPGPFAEPVELPWTVEDKDGDTLRVRCVRKMWRVVTSVDGVDLDATQLRHAARALWAAADAAEASP